MNGKTIVDFFANHVSLIKKEKVNPAFSKKNIQRKKNEKNCVERRKSLY